MSHDMHPTDVARLQTLHDLVKSLAEGNYATRGTRSSQHDLVDQIINQCNIVADVLARQQALVQETEQRGDALIQMMLAMAAGDYSIRAPVGAEDTVLNALATGLNMLNEELEAYRDTRDRLQEEIIQMQAATLRELSTPLIPITDNVLIMPLIGAIDTQRSQQILETLLVGIATQQADVVILDITGVLIADTQVANSLIRAAQAAQLLGAEVILTGIRPEVAQTLVRLGTDLNRIATYSTLQAGVAAVLDPASSRNNTANGSDEHNQVSALLFASH